MAGLPKVAFDPSKSHKHQDIFLALHSAYDVLDVLERNGYKIVKEDKEKKSEPLISKEEADKIVQSQPPITLGQKIRQIEKSLGREHKL